MGQYHLVVNLSKKEFLDPLKFGDGLKLWEMAGHSLGGVSTGLVVLLACSNGRGGGDFSESDIVGRWAGDRIAIVGDYAESTDIPRTDASKIYSKCRSGKYKDISTIVTEYLGKEFNLAYEGQEGWLERKTIDSPRLVKAL